MMPLKSEANVLEEVFLGDAFEVRSKCARF